MSVNACAIERQRKPSGKFELGIHASSMAGGAGTLSGKDVLTFGIVCSKLDGMKDPISLAIDAAGSGPKLAARLRANGAPVTARAIYQWRLRWLAGNARAIPSGRAIDLESAVGIPRHVFRPDLWSVTPQDRAA